MNNNPITAPTAPVATPAKPKKKVPLWVKLLAGVAVLHFGASVLNAATPPPAPLTSEQIAQRDRLIEARERDRQNNRAVLDAMYYVRGILREPGSAEFSDVVAYRPFAGQDTVVACGRVNARNGFGGLTGPMAFVSFAGTASIDDGSDEFARMWRETCMNAPEAAPHETVEAAGG